MKRSIFLRGALAAVFTLALAAVSPAWAQAPFDPPGLGNAMAAKAFHVDGLLAKPGVVGVGVGLTAGGQAAVLIATEGPGVVGLPRRLDGVPVVIMVTGAFNAINKPVDGVHNHGGDDPPPEEDAPAYVGPCDSDPTAECVRPVPIGVSTGNGNGASCSAGTIGFRVKDANGVYALSNNHIYALSNSGSDDIAAIGDPVVQPGVYDSNCAVITSNKIGTLADYEPLDFRSCSNGGTNTIDAAIAKLYIGDFDGVPETADTPSVRTSTPLDEYTPSSETVSETLGQPVQKYGRTTGLTKGSVVGVHFELNVGYSKGTACFQDQIVVEGAKGPFIKAGDSGSGLVTDDDFANPVGLLFAGTRRGIAIANPIGDVLSILGVTIDDGSP